MSELAHVPCPHCFAVNRADRTRKAVPICGRCKTPLFTDHPIALDDSTFDRYVDASDLPVVIDFWAGWCGPCRMMAPQFEAASREAAGRALFAKVDTDAAEQTAAAYGIRSIPTIIAFKNGRELARQSGAMSQAQILRWVESLPK